MEERLWEWGETEVVETKRTVAELMAVIAGATAELAAYAIAGAARPAVASSPAIPAVSTKVLSLKAVAADCGVSEITIKRRVAAGTFPEPLPHERGEHLRWRESDVEAWKAGEWKPDDRR